MVLQMETPSSVMVIQRETLKAHRLMVTDWLTVKASLAVWHHHLLLLAVMH
jgi:hypothetical protein